MTDLSLFDDDDDRNDIAAEAARDDAIDQVGQRPAAERAHPHAAAFVHAHMYGPDGFVSEDILEYIGQLDPDLAKQIGEEPRVLGSVMRTLATRKIARPTFTYRNSGRVKNPQRVWTAI